MTSWQHRLAVNVARLGLWLSAASIASSAQALGDEVSSTPSSATPDGSDRATAVASQEAAGAGDNVANGAATAPPVADGTTASGTTADGIGVAPDVAPPPSIDDLPWELRPYRVQVSLAFANRATMNEEFVASTLASLSRLIDGSLGSYWKSSLTLNDWLFPQQAASLRGLTSESLTARFRETDHDKVLTVVLESSGSTYRLTGCEWDRMTEQRGPVVERTLIDRRRTAAVLFELLLDLFRPLAEIELAEDPLTELRIRGGELLAPESPLFPFQPGDLLTPHFRYLDRDRQVRQIQSVPWTYLSVAELDRSRMMARLETAFSNPLSGSRRRVELVALRVEPAYPETRLGLSPRTNPTMPLVGVRVRVTASQPPEESAAPDVLDLMTNRDGFVSIPSSPGAPLRRLIVHSGGAVLSNVPFVPGVDEQLAMQVPDDSPRLQVEGQLAMLQGDLIDVVSRRMVMLGRAVSLAKKEEFAEADRLLAEVDAQPSIASFESRVLAIRVPAIDQARANRDRSQEKRIRAMCNDLEELARKFLDRTRVKDARDEVSELKKIAGK